MLAASCETKMQMEDCDRMKTYLKLGLDETIQKGDEYRLAGTDYWDFVSDSIGRTVKEQLARDTNQAGEYRRLVEIEWTKHEDGNEFFRTGRYAGKDYFGTRMEIRTTNFRNGSGGHHFGGAREWPAMVVRISFEEGQRAERDAFVKKLQEFLDKELPT